MTLPRRGAVAALDIGSHTAGLTVARRMGERLVVDHDALRFTRLGEGLEIGGALGQGAIQRTVEAVADLLATDAIQGVSSIVAAITSPGRRARNMDCLVDALVALGCAAQVISGEEEAKLTWEGVFTI